MHGTRTREERPAQAGVPTFRSVYERAFRVRFVKTFFNGYVAGVLLLDGYKTIRRKNKGSEDGVVASIAQ